MEGGRAEIGTLKSTIFSWINKVSFEIFHDFFKMGGQDKELDKYQQSSFPY